MPRKRQRLLFSGLLILLALFALLSPSLFFKPPTADLNVGGQKLSLDIASTDAARQQGLSDRNSLPADRGMLFVFSQPGKQCFWMKDMRFSLDMVFLNSKKQIVHIEPNIAPNTYPKNYCADSAQYVIELNAGVAAKLQLHTGQTLSF